MKLRKSDNMDKNIQDYSKPSETKVYEENPYAKHMPNRQDPNKYKPEKKKS